MKKRQKKKNYKKKYGHNPYTTLKRLQKGIKQMRKANESLLKRSIKTAKRVRWMTKDLVSRIEEMPEDEFQRTLKKLSLEQQALARMMRYKRKHD